MDASFDYVRRIVPPTETQFLVPGAHYLGPGDVVSGSIGWWGLRAYNFASVGNNVVKLREDGGNTTQVFVSQTNGGLDLGAIASFANGAGLWVDTLYDQTGNGLDVVQVTTGFQPQFVFSVIGTLPGIKFIRANTTYLLGPNIPVSNQPFTLSAVAEELSSTGYHLFLDTNVANRTFLGFHSGATFVGYAGTEVNSPAISLSIFYAIQAIFNGASSDMYVNGSSDVVDVGTNALGGAGGFWLGGTNVINSLDGYLQEFGMWNMGFSPGQKSDMNSNQRTYWGF